jgi:hypothetical protein
MTTSTEWPRGGPAKGRETSGNKGVLKRRNRLLTEHFRVFSQVGNLGCIEFLNRGPQVRFLPRARGEESRSCLRLPDSSPSASPLVGESEVSRGCPRLEGTWFICAPYPLRRWLSLRPPAKSPRARQGFGSQPDAVQASSPQAVAATTGSGRFAAAPRRRVTPDVLTRLVRTARGSAPRVSRTITSEYRSSARGQDELLEPLSDLVVPRSLSAKGAQDVHRGPEPRCRRCHGEGSVAIQWGTFGYFSDADGYLWKLASDS